MNLRMSLNFWYKWNVSIDAIHPWAPPINPEPYFILNCFLQQHSNKLVFEQAGFIGKTFRAAPMYFVMDGDNSNLDWSWMLIFWEILYCVYQEVVASIKLPPISSVMIIYLNFYVYFIFHWNNILTNNCVPYSFKIIPWYIAFLDLEINDFEIISSSSPFLLLVTSRKLDNAIRELISVEQSLCCFIFIYYYLQNCNLTYRWLLYITLIADGSLSMIYKKVEMLNFAIPNFAES